MTVPNGAILRASARWNNQDFGDLVNVYWFKTTFATAQPEATVFDKVDDAISATYTPWDNYIKTTCYPLDLKVDVVEHIAGKWTVTQNVGFGAWGSTIVPGDTGDAIAAGVAVLGYLRTGLGKHFGRKFFGGITEVASVGGYVASAVQTAVLTGLTALLGNWDIDASNWIEACVPDFANGITRDIVEVAVNSIFAYQRRRKTGVGS